MTAATKAANTSKPKPAAGTDLRIKPPTMPPSSAAAASVSNSTWPLSPVPASGNSATPISALAASMPRA